MGKYGSAVIISASLMVLIAILGFTFFEIVPVKKPVQPSRKFFENDLFALERWLSETGHPVRHAGTAAFADRAVKEKVVYIQASFFSWTPEDGEFLKTWVQEGGRLLVSLDYQWDRTYSEGMEQFLAGLGIQSDALLGGEVPVEPESPPKPVEDPEKPKAGSEPAGAPEAVKPGPGSVDEAPAIDYTIQFNPAALPARISSVKDPQGNLRVVTAALGDGSVSFFGEPLFMRNDRLKEKANARLAWTLTGAEDPEGRGVFFIRGSKALPGLGAKLKAEGDILPPLISCAILLAAGFWMIVPVFGRLDEAPERPGKPIGERFLAEARFLRRYGSLDSYLEPYRETIKQGRARGLEKTPGEPAPLTPDTDAAYCHKLAALCRIDDEEVMALFKRRPKGSPRSGEFVRIMETVHTILERL
jgi:hypothetical protein